MRLPLGVLLVGVLVASCLDLSVPDVPAAPGPGSVQGSVVFASPGRSVFEPAVGASIQLGNSTLKTTSRVDGYFRLEGISSTEGTLLIQFDLNNDGQPDRQKRISLAEVGAGTGKTVSLGQVVLGRNATVEGRVLRADTTELKTGHGGTSIFVPEGPFATQSADDGSFLLENMPEGPLTLAFFRPSYDSTVEVTSLRAGERLSLDTVVLAQKLTADLPGVLRGVVTQINGSALAGVAISAPALAMLVTTDQTGAFSMSLPTGIHTLTFSKAGFASLLISNVFVSNQSESIVNAVMTEAQAGTGGGGDGGGGSGGGGGAGGGGNGGGGGGGGTDAGASGDAGSPADGGNTIVGGASDGGNSPDSGALDAGSTVDAGSQSDAGAGPSDAGAGAQVDAGPLPVAIITPPSNPYASTSTAVLFSGEQSQGTQPLVYHWRHLTALGAPAPDGGIFGAVASNNTDSAFSIVAPITPVRQLIDVELRVTDAFGRQSAPATARAVVSNRPLAVIAQVPTSVVSGTRFRVSAAGSADTNAPPLAITRYEWFAAVGAPLLSPDLGLNGREVLVTAPNVSSPSSFRIGLRVFNAYDAASDALESADIIVTPSTGPSPEWSLTAAASTGGANPQSGTSISVTSGTTVTLSAQVNSSVPNATFTYDWTPKSEPNVPPYSYQVGNSNSAVANFVAPLVSGSTRVLNFSVDVAAQGAVVNPRTQSTNVTVLVEDGAAPMPMNDTIMGATGSIFGVSVFFNEPIEVLVPTTAYLRGVSTLTFYAFGTVVGGQSLVFRPKAVIPPGTQVELVLNGITDTSPQRNRLDMGTYKTFVASLNMSMPSESIATSATDPTPGLLLKKTPMNNNGPFMPTMVQAVGHVYDVGQGFETPWFLEQQSTMNWGCPMPVDNACPVATKPGLNATILATHYLRRSFSFAGTAFVQLQAKGTNGAPGNVMVTSDDAGTPMVYAPELGAIGPIATDSTAMISIGLTPFSTMNLGTYQPLTSSWALTPVSGEPGWNIGSETSPVIIEGRRVFVAGARGVNKTLRLLFNTETGWVAPGLGAHDFARQPRSYVVPNAAGAVPPYDFGVFFLQDFDNAGFLERRLHQIQVSPDPASPVVFDYGEVFAPGTYTTSFDAVFRDGLYFIAAVSGGVLRLQVMSAARFDLLTLPGAWASPYGALNKDPTCQAEYPELVFDDETLYLVWQERCPTKPPPANEWHIEYRFLH